MENCEDKKCLLSNIHRAQIPGREINWYWSLRLYSDQWPYDSGMKSDLHRERCCGGKG